MAQEKVLKIKIDGVDKAINSIDDLEKGVKTLEERLSQAKIGSTEFKQLQNEVKKAKSQLKDFELQVEGLDKEQRATALVDSFNGLTGAVGAVSSAFIAFGAESGAIEEAEKKLLGVIGVVSGLRDVSNGLVATQKLLGNTSVKLGDGLKAAFKGGVTGANALKGAIVATGIGALVVAVGLLVQYWDDIAGAIGLAGSEQEKTAAAAAENVKAQQDALDAISGQENILKLQGKSERDILNLKIAQTDEVIKALEGQIIAQEELKKQQIATAERNKSILSGILRFLTAPLELLLTSIDAIGSALGQDFGLAAGLRSANESIASLVFDPEDVEKKGNETIEETKKQLANLQNARAGYQLQIKQIDQKAADDRQKERDAEQAQAEKDAKEAEDLAKRQADAELQAQLELNEALRQNRVKRLEDAKAIAAQELENTLAQLEEQRTQELAQEELTEQAKLLIKQKYDALKEGAELDYQARLAEIQKEADDKAAEDRQKELEDAIALNEAKFSLTSQSIGAITGLLDAFQTEDEARNKKIFEAQKKFSIAQAIIDTYSAVSSIFANAAANPATILFPAQPYIQAGIALANGLARIKKIQSTQYQSQNAGGGGGGGARPSLPTSNGSSSASLGAPTISTPTGQGQATGQPNQQQIGSTNAPIRTYVLAGDVTSAQNAEAKINQRRTL